MRQSLSLLILAPAFAMASFAANAHAVLDQPVAAPGSYKAAIRIAHGCDGKPTDSIRIEIPEGYVGVKPMPKPGWTLGIETGDYAKAYKIHGETVTSGARAVTWSGGSLDDAWFDEFVLIGTLADVSAGDTLPFKTVQSCGSEKIGWVELAAEGQDPHSLDAPAPVLTIADGGSQGHDHAGMDKVTAGNLELSGNWARAMLPNQPTGGGYLTIANKGDAADRLVGASSPDAGRVEIHSMEVVNNVMTMRPVEGGLEIAPGATVELKPGGFHLMFLDVAKPFTQGEKVPVTLQFEKAGEVAIDLPVRAASGGGHDH